MQSVTVDSLCPRLRWTCLESQVVTRGQSATWPVSISPLVNWWWQHHPHLQGPWGFSWSTVWELMALSPHWFSTLWFLQVTAEDADLLPVNTVSVYRASWSAQGLGSLPGRHLLGQCSLGSKRSGKFLHTTYICLFNLPFTRESDMLRNKDQFPKVQRNHGWSNRRFHHCWGCCTGAST